MSTRRPRVSSTRASQMRSDNVSPTHAHATQVPQYRSAAQDALGRVIPDEGDLRVWLDDDLIDGRAPEGWLHLITAREVCFLLLTGRVVELSLDHDLSDDTRFGKGVHVIDFLDQQHGEHGLAMWPSDGITPHTA